MHHDVYLALKKTQFNELNQYICMSVRFAARAQVCTSNSVFLLSLKSKGDESELNGGRGKTKQN